ncbi:O-methyltransferase [Bacillus cereus group sp. BfR-BA-01380]|uniref:O-methyltransferase n=1 Tax=Bacillus cereus group sp. BfR-BA-01380 TaxID=2920324 RepID=UPI001F56E420|nr:class I SAM-dependent methyltransferase [Bacillus cereus group sp. BfR-BA-01380]
MSILKRNKSVEHLINWLVKEKIVQDDTKFDEQSFHDIKKTIKNNIDLPSTTITPIMERFLYAITSSRNIKNVVVLGSYYGYAQLWLGAGMLHKSLTTITGFDINSNACMAARENLMFLKNKVDVRIECKDAFDGVELIKDDSVDLLFIDVELNGSKREYTNLLKTWQPKLSNNAIVLAHDVCVEKFMSDFEEYKFFLNIDKKIEFNIDLPIDSCGVNLCKVSNV